MVVLSNPNSPTMVCLSSSAQSDCWNCVLDLLMVLTRKVMGTQYWTIPMIIVKHRQRQTQQGNIKGLSNILWQWMMLTERVCLEYYAVFLQGRAQKMKVMERGEYGRA